MKKQLKIALVVLCLVIPASVALILYERGEGDFYIYNLGIDIGPYEAGEFQADSFNPNNLHFDNFFGFGQYLNPDKLNSCFEFRLSSSAHVYAPCDAKIIRIEYQPNDGDPSIGDYSILLAPMNVKGSYSNGWRIDMDHVILDTSLGLHNGSILKAGDVLGTVGIWGSGTGRTEIDITKDGKHYAPMLFVHPSVEDKITAKVQSLVDRFHHPTWSPDNFAAGCWKSEYGDGTYIPESYYDGL